MHVLCGRVASTLTCRALNKGIALRQVRRGDHLVNDSMLQLQNAAARGMLRLPLRVKFAGEDGVDEGGVAKVRLHCIADVHTLGMLDLLGLPVVCHFRQRAPWHECQQSGCTGKHELLYQAASAKCMG